MNIFKKIIIFILSILSIFIFNQLSYSNSNSNYSIIPQNTNISNKPQLDKFLNDVLSDRDTFKSDSNYLVFINNLDNRLDLLKNKFSSNSQIIEMVSYLKEGVNNIKIGLNCKKCVAEMIKFYHVREIKLT